MGARGSMSPNGRNEKASKLSEVPRKKPTKDGRCGCFPPLHTLTQAQTTHLETMVEILTHLRLPNTERRRRGSSKRKTRMQMGPTFRTRTEKTTQKRDGKPMTFPSPSTWINTVRLLGCFPRAPSGRRRRNCENKSLKPSRSIN